MKGYIALTSILLISMIVMALVLSVSFLGIGEFGMILTKNEAEEASFMADLCAEQALMKIESVLNYSGNESVTLGAMTCAILPIEGSGNFNRVVKTQSAVSGNTRKVKIEISQISPKMQISSWQEVADF